MEQYDADFRTETQARVTGILSSGLTQGSQLLEG